MGSSLISRTRRAATIFSNLLLVVENNTLAMKFSACSEKAQHCNLSITMARHCWSLSALASSRISKRILGPSRKLLCFLMLNQPGAYTFTMKSTMRHNSSVGSAVLVYKTRIRMAKVSHLAEFGGPTLAYLKLPEDQVPDETAMTFSSRSRWSRLRLLTMSSSGRWRGDDTVLKFTDSC